jgi:hypothetical protein
MNAVLKPVAGPGRPRQYDRADLARQFEAYIEATEIPIVAEFASQRGVPRFLLYDWPEFSTLLKNCTDKKEAALERKALAGEINVVMAIFGLKQLGWSDRVESTYKAALAKPEDTQAHLESLAHNLERLCVRTHEQAGIHSKPQAEAASLLQGKH